jgi:hypothetical protein
MVRVRHIAAVVALSVLCGTASADVKTVNVVQVGGQAANPFVVFSQTIGTDQPCPGTRLIVNSSNFADPDSFKRFYATMLSAMATGAQVTIAAHSCFSTYPSMLVTDFYFAGG